MRHRITLSIALALSVTLLSLLSSDSTAQAQQRQRFRADTGFVTLGPNQVLRVTAFWVVDNEVSGFVGFRRFDYVQANCSGSMCKHIAANPAAESQELELKPGEAASMDITPMPNSSGVRAVVVSNRRNVRATASIINALTGETTTHIIMANTEGDF